MGRGSSRVEEADVFGFSLAHVSLGRREGKTRR